MAATAAEALPLWGGRRWWRSRAGWCSGVVLLVALALRWHAAMTLETAPPMWDPAAVHHIAGELTTLYGDPGKAVTLAKALKGKSDQEKKRAARELGFPHLPNIVWRGPGYPVLVSAVYLVTGPDHRAAKALNVLFGGLTVWWVLLMGVLALNRRAGLLAMGMVAVLPPLVSITGKLYTETLGVFLLCVGVHGVLTALHTGKRRGAVCGGLMLGLAGLTRASLNQFFPFLAVGLLMACVVKVRRRWAGPALAWSTVGFLVVAVPWAGVNWAMTGVPRISLGGKPGLVLYTGGNYYANNYVILGGDRVWRSSPQLERIQRREGLAHEQVRDEHLKEASLALVREHPLWWLAGGVKKVVFLFTRPWDESLLEFPLPYGGELAVQTALVLLALLGVFWLGRWPFAWVFTTVPLYLAGMFFFVHVEPRYSLPLLPFLALLAALTVDRLLAVGKTAGERMAAHWPWAVAAVAPGLLAWRGFGLLAAWWPVSLALVGQSVLVTLFFLGALWWLRAVVLPPHRGYGATAVALGVVLSVSWVGVTVSRMDWTGWRHTMAAGTTVGHRIALSRPLGGEQAYLAMETCSPRRLHDMAVSVNGHVVKPAGAPMPEPAHNYYWSTSTIRHLARLQRREPLSYSQWLFLPMPGALDGRQRVTVRVGLPSGVGGALCLMADYCLDATCRNFLGPLPSFAEDDASFTKFLTEGDFRINGPTRLQSTLTQSFIRPAGGAPVMLPGGTRFRVRVVHLDERGTPVRVE